MAQRVVRGTFHQKIKKKISKLYNIKVERNPICILSLDS